METVHGCEGARAERLDISINQEVKRNVEAKGSNVCDGFTTPILYGKI